LFHLQSSRNAYIVSGIYDKFGNSCTTSLATSKQHESEAEDLSASSWYQSGIIGKFSEEILQHQTPGTFIIHRVSQAAKYFNTITSLVTHHSVLAEQLPVTLALQRPQEITRRTRDEEINDGDYSIDDLGAIFTDLEV
jgi:hypothetical protein